MNNTMLNNQTKSSKVYQLAIEYSQYADQENLPQKRISISNTNRLPKIIDVDEEDKPGRKKSPFKNIFNIQTQDQMRGDELTNEKSFNIVGRKQVKAYLSKLVKKKNVLQRRNESILSLSRYSSSVKSQNQTGAYLNKEDVLSFLRPNQNSTQNQSKLEREEQMMTMGSNGSKMCQFEMTSLKRSKDAFEKYNRTWDNQKMKKVKFPSILDHIASYRKKVEEMEYNTLKEKTYHIKDTTWIDTLRVEKSLQNFYCDKYVEKILKGDENFCLKGKDKLQKEMRWIDDKDRAGYTFAFLDNLAIQPGRQTRDEKTSEKEQKTTDSSFNRTGMRESLTMDKNKDLDLPAPNIVVKSNLPPNMKGALRQSSLGNGMMQIKGPSKPVVMSQFSSPIQNGGLMSIKNRPGTIGEGNEGREERKSTKMR